MLLAGHYLLIVQVRVRSIHSATLILSRTQIPIHSDLPMTIVSEKRHAISILNFLASQVLLHGTNSRRNAVRADDMTYDHRRGIRRRLVGVCRENKFFSGKIALTVQLPTQLATDWLQSACDQTFATPPRTLVPRKQPLRMSIPLATVRV